MQNRAPVLCYLPLCHNYFSQSHAALNLGMHMALLVHRVVGMWEHGFMLCVGSQHAKWHFELLALSAVVEHQKCLEYIVKCGHLNIKVVVHLAILPAYLLCCLLACR